MYLSMSGGMCFPVRILIECSSVYLSSHCVYWFEISHVFDDTSFWNGHVNCCGAAEARRTVDVRENGKWKRKRANRNNQAISKTRFLQPHCRLCFAVWPFATWTAAPNYKCKHKTILAFTDCSVAIILMKSKWETLLLYGIKLNEERKKRTKKYSTPHKCWHPSGNIDDDDDDVDSCWVFACQQNANNVLRSPGQAKPRQAENE